MLANRGRPGHGLGHELTRHHQIEVAELDWIDLYIRA